MVKNPPANAGDTGNVGLIPGSGRSPGGGHGNSLQYSCLENLTDRGAWWAIVHGLQRVEHEYGTEHAHAQERVIIWKISGGPDIDDECTHVAMSQPYPGAKRWS